MKLTSGRAASTVLVLVVVCTPAWNANAGRELVKFPEKYAEDVHYATVTRGNIREEIYATGAAVEAVKRGNQIPSGTVITLVDYRDGRLYRYIVMEKRTGWGTEYPADRRNGEWEFQAFDADKSVNENENIIRCFSCHKSQAAQDFVYTLGQMKNAK